MELEKFNWLKNRYRLYLFSHVLVIIAVIIFFRVIPDIKMAALAAATLFISGPLLVLFFELKSGSFGRSLSFYGALIFFFASSLPIFALRISNWDERFENLSLPSVLGGFTGPQLHQVSNYFFLGMVATFALDSLIATSKARAKIKSDT